MARNPRISFVPNGKNSKMIPGYFLKPNATHQARRTAGARHERTLEAVACMRLILIEAPSPADHRGMLRAGKQCREQGGDLKEILHDAAPILLRHRPPRPDHGRLHARPGRRGSRAPHHANRPGGLPESSCPVSTGSRRGSRVPVHLVLSISFAASHAQPVYTW